jgi:hypothetical protein
MKKTGSNFHDENPSIPDRRAFMGRISRLGILGIAGGMLIHDVREGRAAPQQTEPGQKKDPKEEPDCGCYCHCTCDCDCNCGCGCECTCKECSCGCTCPQTLTEQVKSADKINLDHAADNTVHVANAGATKTGDLENIFLGKEKTNRTKNEKDSGKKLANGVAQFKYDLKHPPKKNNLRNFLGL